MTSENEKGSLSEFLQTEVAQKKANPNSVHNSSKKNENLGNMSEDFYRQKYENMPDTSPFKYQFSNLPNLLISPMVENKHSHLTLSTPKSNYHPNFMSGLGSTPNLQYDTRIFESPFEEKNIRGLNHDEKSSSFRRTQSSASKQLIGTNLNTREFFNKNFSSGKKEAKYLIPSKNSMVYKMNFSSEEENSNSSSEAEDEKTTTDKIKIIRPINDKKLCCTCTKTKCIKKYCECFATGQYCNGCECTNCYNLPQFKHMINRSLEFEKKTEEEESQSEKLEIICNCTKSNCTKKYCECFKAGGGCKDTCRCINCENGKKKETIIIKSSNTLYSLSETDKEKMKAARNPKNYIIEGTSVYICNEDISITQRKETPQFKFESKIKNGNDEDIVTQENLFRKKHLMNNKFKVEDFSGGWLQEGSETPIVTNKKRKRIMSCKGDSMMKSSSTQFQTPLFNASASEKRSLTNKKVQMDDKIVKNLDKIYY